MLCATSAFESLLALGALAGSLIVLRLMCGNVAVGVYLTIRYGRGLPPDLDPHTTVRNALAHNPPDVELAPTIVRVESAPIYDGADLELFFDDVESAPAAVMIPVRPDLAESDLAERVRNRTTVVVHLPRF